MPTAARLIAALFMGATGYILALGLISVKEALLYMPYMSLSFVLLGATVGWKFIGPRTGEGWTVAASLGITGGVLTILLCMTSLAFREMLKNAFRKHYDNALEAILAVIHIGLGDAMALATTITVVPVIIGALLSGLGAEAASRRWR